MVEQQRVSQKNLEDDVVLLDNAVKWYTPNIFERYFKTKPPFCAVKGVSYGVKRGECFGLLGPNGAGKSTTISMLMLEEYPTEGKIMLNDMDVVTHSRSQVYRSVPMGVCFQADALFDYMTVTEHISLFLQLRNVFEPSGLEKETKRIITLMDLSSYAKRNSRSLSGGNKRKLCTALGTIIGNKIIYLDEPSTGMDPGARRALWEVIAHQTTDRGNTVVLTTHSMEEAESVCNKIAIMVNGQLRCIGSSQHLKTRFGGSYRLTLTMKDPNDPNFQHRIESLLGRSLQFIEGYGGTITFDIGVIDSLSNVFDIFEKEKDNAGILNYSLYQVNLEQVFMYHAKQQVKQEPQNYE